MSTNRVREIANWADEAEEETSPALEPPQVDVRTQVASLDNIKKGLDRCLMLLTTITSRVTSLEEGQTDIGRRLVVMETAISRIQTITQSSGFERTRTRYE